MSIRLRHILVLLLVLFLCVSYSGDDSSDDDCSSSDSDCSTETVIMVMIPPIRIPTAMTATAARKKTVMKMTTAPIAARRTPAPAPTGGFQHL
jgi:hypothetical protein